MKFTQEQFAEHIKTHVESLLGGNEIQEQFKKMAESVISDMQTKISKPMSEATVSHLVYTLPFAKVDGHYLTTHKGSIIDLHNKNAPGLPFQKICRIGLKILPII